MLILNYIISASTDIGTTKKTNQDSLSVKILDTSIGRMAFAILCDGMGGLEKGEVASAAVINAFNNWVTDDLPKLCTAPLMDDAIRLQWTTIITQMNEKIKGYGARQGVKLGTTAVIMLITDTRYYIMNVGDSRAYQISDRVTQLTNDQTFVAREIALGNMTPEQAETDSRRNVLLQCVGASDEVYPDMFYGDTTQNAIYMLCSDGFRHVISDAEIYEKLNPAILFDENNMSINSKQLIELDKSRGETDNISVALVRTF